MYDALRHDKRATVFVDVEAVTVEEMYVKTIQITSFLMALSALPAFAADAPDLYSKLFPYSVEICMGTQTRQVGYAEGGSAGHSVAYIHGACIDRDYPYPQLKMCDPSHGVGVSDDQVLKNVNWIAVEDRDFFFNGSYPADKAFDQQDYEKVVAKAIATGMFDNIQVQSKYSQDPGENPNKYPDATFLPHEAIGSDYGLTLVRNVYCSRIPFSRDALANAIHELNEVNHHYYVEGNEFTWDVLKNNCAHATHNALAAAGYWSPLKTEAVLPVQLFNIAVPLNQVVDAETRGNDLQLENVRALYNDPVVRKAVLSGEPIPTRPGVLIEAMPQHLKDNKVFMDSPQLGLMLDMPLFSPMQRKMNRILREDRYIDLKTNLIDFKDRYEQALKNRVPVDYWSEVSAEGSERTPVSSDFKNFESKYYEYLKQQLEFVNSALKQIP